MITFCANDSFGFLKTISTSSVTLIIGLLGFTSAILTLIYSHFNNKKNLNLLLEKDIRERQRAYNRVLGSFLKVYHSYIKHKYLFNEDGVLIIPDKYLVQMLDKIDNFNSEINSFRKCIANETEILPELTIYLHELLDLLGRFELLSSAIPTDPMNPNSEQMKVLFQRAHTYAVKELLDEYFTDLIETIAKRADVSEEFLQDINAFNSTETIEKNIKMQEEIMTRMMQSLSRQLGGDVKIEDFFSQESN
jgi:hypothetical protein